MAKQDIIYNLEPNLMHNLPISPTIARVHWSIAKASEAHLLLLMLYRQGKSTSILSHIAWTWAAAAGPLIYGSSSPAAGAASLKVTIIASSPISAGWTVLKVSSARLWSTVVPLLKPIAAEASLVARASTELASACKFVPKALSLIGRLIVRWSFRVWSTALLSVVGLVSHGTKFGGRGVGAPWAFVGESATDFLTKVALEVGIGFMRSLVRSATLN